MERVTVRKAPLVWWVGGLALGLTQVLAVAVKGPLGVSTPFVVADSMIIHRVDSEYAQSHTLISADKYRKFGYGWWLDIGLLIGAFVAAVATRRWRLSIRPSWWKANHAGRSNVVKRLLTSFVGGVFILMGARLAHGCMSGLFASGWAQLSLAAVPFTIGMFAAGMFVAWLVYPRSPQIERQVRP